MKTTTFRFILGATAVFCLAAGTARIVESRTLALGTMGNVDGFEADYDLTTWGYGKNHYSHSREFRSNIIADRAFWKAIFDNIK